MKRDFTEAIKTEFINLVQEVNESEWLKKKNPLDNVDDLLTFDVQFPWNTLEDYYRKMIDKNDMTVGKINEIWGNVQILDSTYQARFLALNELAVAYKEKLRILCDKIKPENIVNTLSESSEILKEKIININKTIELAQLQYLVEYYTITDGKKIIDYEWEKIHFFMQKPQKQVTEIEYKAFIQLIENMDIEQIEKFIEKSYLENPESFPVQGTCVISNNWKYTLSPNFIKLAGKYYAEVEILLGLLGFDNTELSLQEGEICNYMKKQGLLQGVCQNASSLYYYGTFIPILEELSIKGKINVTIEEAEREGSTFYKIHFEEGYTELFDWSLPQNDKRETYFEVYPYRADLQTKLGELTKESVKQMKRNSEQEIFKYGMDKVTSAIFGEAVDGSMEMLLEQVKNGSYILKGYDLTKLGVEASVEIPQLIKEIDEQNKNVNQIIENLNTAKLSSCLMFGAQVTKNHDGTIKLNHLTFDKDDLDYALSIYKQYTGKTLDSEEIINQLTNDNFEITEDWKQYIEWYSGDGNGRAKIKYSREK